MLLLLEGTAHSTRIIRGRDLGDGRNRTRKGRQKRKCAGSQQTPLAAPRVPAQGRPRSLEADERCAQSWTSACDTFVRACTHTHTRTHTPPPQPRHIRTHVARFIDVNIRLELLPRFRRTVQVERRGQEARAHGAVGSACRGRTQARTPCAPPSWRGAPVRLVTGAVACAGAIARCHGAVPREAGRGCRCQSCHRQRSSSVGGHHRCGATEKRCTAVGASTPQVPGASAAWRQGHCVLLASPTPLCWRGNSGLRHVPLRFCQQASARQRQSKNLRESTRETPAHACRKKKACTSRELHTCVCTCSTRFFFLPNLELIPNLMSKILPLKIISTGPLESKLSPLGRPCQALSRSEWLRACWRVNRVLAGLPCWPR